VSDFLLPIGDQPPNDLALSILIDATIVGITGLSGTLVRPRWQPTPPVQPDGNTNWVAVGITPLRRNQPQLQIIQQDDGDYLLTHNHQQELDVLCSFYGPDARGFAELLADGITIPNNRWVLEANSIRFIRMGETRSVPSIVNASWINRADIVMTLTRDITRTYDIPSILAATATVYFNNETAISVEASIPIPNN
jgi:hypothetical protein